LNTKFAAPGVGAPFAFAARMLRSYCRAPTGLAASLISAVASFALTACGGGGGSAVPPLPTTYSITASVTGLLGSGLTLKLASGTPVNVSGNGVVTLATDLSTGTAYSVTIDTQPINPVQTCSVTGGSGNVAGANAKVTVSCVAGNATTVNAAKATVTIDASVPPSGAAIISSVVSPIDSQKIGTPLYVPISEVAGETLILAVDANQNILLASLTTTNAANLSAGTTALALVRLAIGALPNTSASGQLNGAIQATPEFPNLIALISAALTANTSPVTSSAVYSSIAAVLGQLPSTLVTALEQSSRTIVHALAGPVASPSVTNSLPYALISFSTKFLPEAVSVTGTAATGDLQISNSTLIAWSLASATVSGQKLCAVNNAPSTGNPDCSITIPQTDVLHLLGSVVNIDTISTAIVENDAGGSFNLVLEQNIQSRTGNVVQIFKDVGSTIVAFAVAEVPAATDCFNSVVDVLLPASDVETLAAAQSGEAVKAYIDGVFSTDSLIKEFFGCAKYLIPGGSNSSGPASFSTALAGFAFGLSKFAFQEISAAATAVGIPAEIYDTLSYWNFSKVTFGVCEAQNPPPTLVISNCAQSFAFTPATITLVPSDSFLPTIGMTSKNGVEPSLNAYLGPTGTGGTTLVPPDLQYSSSQDGTVIDLNAGTGAVEALALGSGQTSAQANVTVTEISTGLTASYMVNVNSLATMVANADPTAVLSSGGPVTLSVTLGPPAGAISGSPTPTGTVSFTDTTGATLCAQPVPVQAGLVTCSANIATAPDFITANYSGDANYAPNSANVAVGLTASIPTALTLTDAPTALPSSGGSVTLTATIAPQSLLRSGTPAPTGTVTFTDTTGATFCAQPVTVTAGVGTCTASIATIPDTITANYGGDANYAASTGSATIALNCAAQSGYPLGSWSENNYLNNVFVGSGSWNITSTMGGTADGFPMTMTPIVPGGAWSATVYEIPEASTNAYNSGTVSTSGCTITGNATQNGTTLTFVMKYGDNGG
jgi:Big-like domain-containing protein